MSSGPPGEPVHSPRCSGRERGIAYAFIGTLAVSPDSLFTKLASQYGGDEGSFWTFVAFKSLLIAAFTIFYVAHEQRGLSRLRRSVMIAPGRILLSSILQALVNVGFALSFYTTTAAKALLFISLNPLWAALLGWRLLGDALPPQTIAVMVVAGVAIMLVLVPPLVLDEASAEGALHGDMVAVATGISLATYITNNRYCQKSRPGAALSLTPFLGGLLSFVATVPVAFARSECCALRSAAFWGLLVVDALVTVAVSIFALVLAPKYARGAEVAIVLLLENILGPLWTYLGLGEVPSRWTFYGGGMLLGSLFLHEVWHLWSGVSSRFSQKRADEDVNAEPSTTPAANGVQVDRI